jgi:hypothetical protein
MPEPRTDDLSERIREAGPGLSALVDEAQQTWHGRMADHPSGGPAAGAEPGWRSFEDAFPTFYQFTNKPR